jgi:hypothetical protein
MRVRLEEVRLCSMTLCVSGESVKREVVAKSCLKVPENNASR